MVRHPWVIGTAGSLGILGLAATSGFVALAHYFVDELSRPHQLTDEAFFTWEVPREAQEPPPSLRRSLLFRTSDGKLLCGDFWAQPHAAPTVVVCHGYRISRAHLRPVAALEYAFGYNVLLFDFRGHGESESVATSGGNAEIHDLQAALTVAGQQPETVPGKIIIHGFSMGASIALLTPPQPGVVAIIADSPYARLDAILRRFVQWHLLQDSMTWKPPLRQLRHTFPAIAWGIVAVSRVVFRLRFGHALMARPYASFKRWRRLAKANQPPILLIHGMQDDLIPIAHAHKIAAAAQAANITLEMYLVDKAPHCGAYTQDPERYVQVLQAFVARHLGDDFPHGSALEA